MKMKGEFLWSIYIVSRIGYLVLWPAHFTFFLAFIEGEPLAKEYSILTGRFISDNEDLSKTSSSNLTALLGLAQRRDQVVPESIHKKIRSQKITITKKYPALLVKKQYFAQPLPGAGSPKRAHFGPERPFWGPWAALGGPDLGPSATGWSNWVGRIQIMCSGPLRDLYSTPGAHKRAYVGP